MRRSYSDLYNFTTLKIKKLRIYQPMIYIALDNADFILIFLPKLFRIMPSKLLSLDKKNTFSPLIMNS